MISKSVSPTGAMRPLPPNYDEALQRQLRLASLVSNVPPGPPPPVPVNRVTSSVNILGRSAPAPSILRESLSVNDDEDDKVSAV